MSFSVVPNLTSFVSGVVTETLWHRWVRGPFWHRFLARPVVILTGADIPVLRSGVSGAPARRRTGDPLSRDVQQAVSNVEVSVFRRGGRLADWQERGWLVPESAAIHTSLVLIGGPDENGATAALMELFGISRSDLGAVTPLHGSQGSILCLRADKGPAAALVIMGDTADGVSLAARWLAMDEFRREKSPSFIHQVQNSLLVGGEPVLSHRHALAVADWS